MKLRSGGPQDLVDAGRLEALPGFDRERFVSSLELDHRRHPVKVGGESDAWI